MKIYVEDNDVDIKIKKDDNKDGDTKISHRDISSIFNIHQLKKELAEEDIYGEFQHKKIMNNGLQSVSFRVPYKGTGGVTTNTTRSAATVALIVDYKNNKALALPRAGADSELMKQIAKIANKLIQKPFEVDQKLKTQI